MMSFFDYVRPELFDFNEQSAQGESCYIDCEGDAVCPGEDDEI